MELAQINQRIAIVNAESKRLNNERAVNIGKRETLQKQLDEALASYKATYGVDITAETLDAEIARVSSEKIKEVEKIETMLGLIKAGRYDEANAIVGAGASQEVQTTESVQVVQPTESVQPSSGVVNPFDPIMGKMGQPVDPSDPSKGTYKGITPTVEPKTPDLGSPVERVIPDLGTPVPQPATPVAPNLGESSGVVQPKKPVLSGLDLGDDDTGASHLGMPPVFNKPSAPVQSTGSKPTVASFNAILGGSAFKPQGEV